MRLLKRYGNKLKEFKKIKDKVYQFIEDHKIKNIVEPFAGSMGCSYVIYEKFKDKLNYYGFENDETLYNYVQILKKPSIKDAITNVKNIIDDYQKDRTQEKYEKIKEKINNNKTDEDIIMRMTYYAIREGLIPRPQDKKNSKYEINEDEINFYKSINYILNADFNENIKQFNIKDTLFILDPPYYSSFNFHYEGTKIQDDNKKIVDNSIFYTNIKHNIMKNKKMNYIFYINSNELLCEYYSPVEKYKINYNHIYNVNKKKETINIYSSFDLS